MKDPLVVRTVELATVLQMWVDKHHGRFPLSSAGNRSSFNYGGTADQATYYVGAYDYILNNISDRGTINERSIYRILSLESKHTELRIADAILCAVEESGALADGRIKILPNPQWNKQLWLEWKSQQGCI